MTSANKMVYPEGTFLWRGLLITSFKTIAYVVDKQSDVCRRYLQLQGLCVPSVKTTTYVCNRLNTSFCARDHKTNQAISNLTLSRRRPLLHRNQSIDLLWKSIDWFLYDNGLRHEIVKSKILKQINPANQINDFLDRSLF